MEADYGICWINGGFQQPRTKRSTGSIGRRDEDVMVYRLVAKEIIEDKVMALKATRRRSC